ncbi:hypothetical protein IF2G_03625 [Cordyceps javanica]|nr:hypothetical protein IF2G_03625 [Cordyceps javanica]
MTNKARIAPLQLVIFARLNMRQHQRTLLALRLFPAAGLGSWEYTARSNN